MCTSSEPSSELILFSLLYTSNVVKHRASEKCREAAVESYARGQFQDAGSLYQRSLALLQVLWLKRSHTIWMVETRGFVYVLVYMLCMHLIHIHPPLLYRQDFVMTNEVELQD